MDLIKKMAEKESEKRNFASAEVKDCILKQKECEILRDMLAQSNKLSRSKLAPFLDQGFVHVERKAKDDKYVVDKDTIRKRQ